MKLLLTFLILLLASLGRGSQKRLRSEDLIYSAGRVCSNATVFPSSVHSLTEDDRKFCKWAESDIGGKVKRGGGLLDGGSWGRLRSSEMRKRYVDLMCSLVTSIHPRPSCDALWGDDLVKYWRKKGQRARCVAPNGHEVMKCHRSAGELSTQCTLKDAIVDLSLISSASYSGNSGKEHKKSRFPHGFIQAENCITQGDWGELAMHNYPVYKVLEQITLSDIDNPPRDYVERFQGDVRAAGKAFRTHQLNCTFWIKEPVLLVSHVDYKDLTETLNDMLNVWLMLWLSGLSSAKNATLLIIDHLFERDDSLLEGTKRFTSSSSNSSSSSSLLFATKTRAKMKLPPGINTRPDRTRAPSIPSYIYFDRRASNVRTDDSPYYVHYERNFKQVIRRSTHPNARICISEMILPPSPLIQFLWDGRKFDTRCSKSISSLLQRLNVNLRFGHGLLEVSPEYKRSEEGLAVIHILIIERTPAVTHTPEGNLVNMTYRFSSSALGNSDQVIAALKELQGVEVTLVDFGKISFEEQLLMVAQSSIIIGLQTADLSHALHMSIGHVICCGVIELVPYPAIAEGLSSKFARYQRALSNAARKLGIYHHRLEVTDFNSMGRLVPPPLHLKEDVQLMATKLRVKPTCIHPDVLKDPNLNYDENFNTKSYIQQQTHAIQEKTKEFWERGHPEISSTPPFMYTTILTDEVDGTSTTTSESDYERALNYSSNPFRNPNTGLKVGETMEDFISTFDLNRYNATVANVTLPATGSNAPDRVHMRKKEDEFFESLAEFVSPSSNVESTVSATVTEVSIPKKAVAVSVDQDEGEKGGRVDESVISNSISQAISPSMDQTSLSTSHSAGSTVLRDRNDAKKYMDDYFVDVLFDDEITPLRLGSQQADDKMVNTATNAATAGDNTAVTFLASMSPTTSSVSPMMLTPATATTDPDYVFAADSTPYPTTSPTIPTKANLNNDPDYVLASDSTSYPVSSAYA